MTQIECFFKEGLQYQDFEFLEPVASGTFGDVIKAVNKTLKENLYAAKIITIRPSELQTKEPEILHEIGILEKISNLSIKPKAFPKYYGYTKETTAIKQTNYYILFDFLPLSLRSLIKSRKNQGDKCLEFEHLSRIYKELIGGLSCLQSMNLTHRDLKPENLLLDEKQNVNIVDFGTTKENNKDLRNARKNETKINLTIAGTPIYMSPEMLLALENDDDSIVANPYKSDVFSFGLVVLELGTFTQLKFNSSDIDKIQSTIEDAIEYFNDNYSSLVEEEDKIQFQGISETLKNCLQIDPKNRPDFIELFKRSLDVSQKEKLRYHIFIQESNVETLHYLFDILKKESLSKEKVIESKRNSIDSSNDGRNLKSLISFNSFENPIPEKHIRSINALQDPQFAEFTRGGFIGFSQLEEYFQLNEIQGLDFNGTITMEALEGFFAHPLKSLKSFLMTGTQENGVMARLCQLVRDSQQISTLDLSNNPIAFGTKKCSIADLCEAIKKTKVLSCLKMTGNYLGGCNENMVVLGIALKINKTLKQLELGNNRLGVRAENIQSITDGVIASNSIEILDLSRNKLSNKSQNMKNLAKCLNHIETLQKLSIWGNCLYKDPEGLREFSESVKINKKLQVLDLNKNKLGLQPKSFEEFCQALKINKGLLELKLGQNELGKNSKNLKELTEALKHNSTLVSLDLGDNSLCYDIENMRLLVNGLKTNTTLRRLCLESNDLGYNSQNLRFLADLCRENQGLQSLDLKRNKLAEAENFETLANSWLDNKNLRLLDLRSNNLNNLSVWVNLVKILGESNPSLKMTF